MKNGAFILLAAMLFVACDPCKEFDPPDPSQSTELIDVCYGNHKKRNTMDVYLPAGRDANTPVIFLLHAGYWISGDKNSLAERARQFADSGFAAVPMNYQYANYDKEIHHPAQLEDIADAMEYVREHAGDWNVSADRFGMCGMSAGSHLSLVYAYAWDSQNDVKAILGISSPTDLTDPTITNNSSLTAAERYMGFPLSNDRAAWQSASPIFNVNASVPPTRLVVGQTDNVIPWQQSQRLADTLTALGVVHELEVFPGEGHLIWNSPVADSIFAEGIHWMRGQF